jgi:hypothetical protein
MVTDVNGGMPYEVIPRSWHARIVNRRDFVGMAVFDLWAHALHRRQAVFAKDGNGLRAIFIESCNTFGSASQPRSMQAEDALFWDRSIYDGMWKGAVVGQWMEAIATIKTHEVHALIDTLSRSWVMDSWRYGVTSLLEESRKALEHTVQYLPLS